MNATARALALRPTPELVTQVPITALDLSLERRILPIWHGLRSTLTSDRKIVTSALSLEHSYTGLDAETLRQAATDGRQRLGEVPDDEGCLARLLALCGQASHRALGLKPYPVQLLGALTLYRGGVAEMATGEGKTLTAGLAVGLLAARYPSVHVVTVNDYLAQRDQAQLAPLFDLLGLSSSCATEADMMSPGRATWQCNITYATQKSLVFQYLRDREALGFAGYARHAVSRLGQRTGRVNSPPVLTGLHCALVDEADSVFVDEAQTPFILSGEGSGGPPVDILTKVLDLARRLDRGRHFEILDQRDIVLLPLGEAEAHQALTALPAPWCSRVLRLDLMRQALRALHPLIRDQHYLIKDDRIALIDESTGRIMADRTLSLGLHQMVEVKEGLEPSAPNETRRAITFQRFFPRYRHLCGMTGTGQEIRGSLAAVYGLRVVRVPPNKPSRRRFLGARLFATQPQKWQAIVQQVIVRTAQGQPVLIGTRSVAASEALSCVFAEKGVTHQLLNARQDANEAEMVAKAGQSGMVTIATNMAGRGTDIAPDQAALDAGGLHVILTEFHETSRLDRQLIGRTGRKGQPGTAQAIVSLEDEFFQFSLPGIVKRLVAQMIPAQGLGGALPRLLKSIVQSRGESKLASRFIRACLLDAQRRKQLAFAGRTDT